MVTIFKKILQIIITTILDGWVIEEENWLLMNLIGKVFPKNS